MTMTNKDFEKSKSTVCECSHVLALDEGMLWHGLDFELSDFGNLFSPYIGWSGLV